MEKIPTAKTFIEMNSEDHSLIDIEGIMIEFAKLHVEAALKVVVNNVEIGDYDLNVLAISKEYKNNWGGLKGIREYNAFIDGAETMIGLIASQCSTGFTPLKAEQYYNETFKQQEL
jgi:hypothetical protein